MLISDTWGGHVTPLTLGAHAAEQRPRFWAGDGGSTALAGAEEIEAEVEASLQLHFAVLVHRVHYTT